MAGAYDSLYLPIYKTDFVWLFVCGALVFFMQCGFALLEAGTVRAKNTKNILLKNLLDACVGALIWWSMGYMIAVRALARSLACPLASTRAARPRDPRPRGATPTRTLETPCAET